MAKARTHAQVPTKRSAKSGNYPWSQAVKDMTVTAMKTGQLPVYGLLFVTVIIVWRLPPDELARVTNSILEHLYNFSLAGYVLFGVALGGWYYHVQRIRREMHSEYERMGREKSEAQSIAAGKAFPSSTP